MPRGAQKKMGRNGSKFPGICLAASALGVNRNHLLMVLKKQRSSKTLIARYKQLRGNKLTIDQQLLISDFNRRQAKKGATSP
jgi:hypothetical protein